jgi:hypothetical protein
MIRKRSQEIGLRSIVSKSRESGRQGEKAGLEGTSKRIQGAATGRKARD